MLIDTHCHLIDGAFDADREAVAARAAAAGVGHVVIVAGAVPDIPRARAAAGRFGLSATAGVHPHEASSWSDDAAAAVTDALADDAVVAVGETGLDYHYDHSPRPVQRAAFEAQLALAAAHHRPVVVHAREADDDVAAILRAWGPRVPAVVLHSFSAGRGVFDAGQDIGAYFGWSGMVTFRNWDLDDLLLACPADRLLVETDAPYLAPVPHRGKRNEPAFVREIARRVAVVRGLAEDELVALTTDNAARCFGPRVTEPQHTSA